MDIDSRLINTESHHLQKVHNLYKNNNNNITAVLCNYHISCQLQDYDVKHTYCLLKIRAMLIPGLMGGGPWKLISSAGTIHTMLQRKLTAPLLKTTIHKHTHITQILLHLVHKSTVIHTQN